MRDNDEHCDTVTSQYHSDVTARQVRDIEKRNSVTNDNTW